MAKFHLQPAYSTITRANAKKDLFLVSKSSDAVGTYSGGNTRRLTVDEAKQILSIPIQIKLTIPVASVKTGQSVPIVFIAAPGAGLVNKVLEYSCKLVYNGVAYDAASGGLKLITDTATVELGTCDIIKKTATTFKSSIFSSQGDLLANKAIMIQLDNDSTVGDGTVTVYATYIVFEE